MVGATSGFEYDSAGNQTRAKAEDGSWLKFEYDAANRLLVVKNDSGTYLQAFQYGSSNQRLMDLDYIYGYLKILAHGGAVEYTEFAGTVPTWTKSYIYLGDSQLSTITPDASGGEITEYNHPDRLGTKLTTNQSLGTSYEQTTLPFGTALNAETSGSQSKRFTSYERSARTGLDYAINRTYDSKQGRFTQVDPIGISASSPGSPQTLNLYTYCGNDPVNHIDPDGLFFGSLFKWIGKIFKAINKILKWVIVAVVIATVVIAAFYSLGAAAGFLKVMMGIVAKIAGFAAKATGYIIANFASAIGVGIAEGASISAGVILNAGLYGVGAVASQFAGRQKGDAATLGPKYSKLYVAGRNIILALLRDSTSSCHKFLVDKGFDPAKLAENLESNTPYDALRSINLEDFGTLDKRVDKYFRANKAINKVYPRAATSSGNVRRTYYFRTGLNAQTILHETIHRVYSSGIVREDGVPVGIDDEALGLKIGLATGAASSDSTIIDDELAKAGCK